MKMREFCIAFVLLLIWEPNCVQGFTRQPHGRSSLLSPVTSLHRIDSSSLPTAFVTSRASLLEPSRSFLHRSLSVIARDDSDDGITNAKSSDVSNTRTTNRLVKHIARTLWHRLDTIDTAGLKNENVLQNKSVSLWRYYFGAAVLAWCYKWYRARFINKIPVWDRQPQWNMVITKPEQERDLRAYTCKNCGATMFIARNREWFFESQAGLAGLGCFTCGAKGADNFVMDRDRILEDVKDIDDYFDYERPLDFVTAAERREALKKAKGDESKANEILSAEQDASDSDPAPAATAFSTAVAEASKTTEEEEEVKEETTDEVVPEPTAEVPSAIEDMKVEEDLQVEPVVEPVVEEVEEEPVIVAEPEPVVVEEEKEEVIMEEMVEPVAVAPPPAPVPAPTPPAPAPQVEDDLDVLGMDDF